MLYVIYQRPLDVFITTFELAFVLKGSGLCPVSYLPFSVTNSDSTLKN